MNISRRPSLLLLILAFLAIVLPGWCEQPKQPDPLSPFGPSGMWFFHEGGWSKLHDRSSYAVHLLFDPPLTYKGAEPIGVSIENISGSVGRGKDENPKPATQKACSFEGLIWTLVDQFGYSARVLTGQDGSLLGFSFRVWNNSKNHPLTLMRVPEAPSFGIILSIGDANYSNRKGKVSRTAIDPKPTEWILKPSEKEEVFVPVRGLFPEGFDPKDGTQCLFTVEVDVRPKGEPPDGLSYVESPFPHVSGMSALITKEGLAIDPKEALKEAEKNTPDPLPNK